MMESLFRKNRYAALAHAGSFLLVVLLFNYYSSSQKHAKSQTFRYAIPRPIDPIGGVTCNSDNLPISQIAGKCQTDAVYAPPKKTLSFNVINGVLVFFAITAFAHLFYATDGFNSGEYSRVISEGWNPYRWVEYGASASIMIILIASELGIRDSNHLTSLVFMNAALQLCGFLVENALISKPLNTTIIKGVTIVGWTLFIGTWVPIIYSFYALYKDINDNFKGQFDTDGKPIKIPSFVWFIVMTQIINFAWFGYIQFRQIGDTLAGQPKPFSVYESKYLTLSFAGKLALASGLAYGLLFRTKNC